MKLVVVSPHLDDAVFCAGGGMGIVRSFRIDVLVVTIFTGSVRADRLSGFARAFHKQCSLDDDVAVAVRRREDAGAADVLDVGYRWLDLPDALYRTAGGGPLYDSDEKLFGRPGDADEETGVVTRARLRPHIEAGDAVLLPLSVGGHVDHALARRWGETVAREAGTRYVCYYEESMYEQRNGAAAWIGVSTAGLERLEVAVPASLHSLKERAVCAYESQLVMLGVGPARPMERANFLARLGVEGYWQPVADPRSRWLTFEVLARAGADCTPGWSKLSAILGRVSMSRPIEARPKRNAT